MPISAKWNFSIWCLGENPPENIVVSKELTRIGAVVAGTLTLSAVAARPALAALKYGSYELSQLAQSSRLFECQALVLFGIGSIFLAFVLRKWQDSAE
jgi:hypothetical protein